MTAGSFSFYTPKEYWLDLQRRIDNTPANGRIAIMVMDLETTDPLMQSVFDSLLAAAKRGVEVLLCVDAHTFMTTGTLYGLSSYWLTNDMKRLSRPLKAKFELLEQLNAYQSGRAEIINRPTHALSNPVAGRSHIKVTVVDDYAYVGGCNFQQPGWVDAMVGWQSSANADYLFEFISSVAQKQSTGAVMQGMDRTVHLCDEANLFIDAGKPGQSVILEQALALIDTAERSIFMTCQYFPNSITARHLAAAHARGVHIELIYAHPRMQSGIGSLGQHLNILIERTRTPAVLFKGRLPAKGPSLHAKLLATDKGAIIGSHNYVRAGVKLGTAEIALVCHDPAFSKQAIATVRREFDAMQAQVT